MESKAVILLFAILILLLRLGDKTEAKVIRRRRNRNKEQLTRDENIAGFHKQEDSSAESEEPSMDLAVRGGRGKRRRRNRGRKSSQGEPRRRNSSILLPQRNQSLVWKCGSIRGTLFNHFMQVKYMLSIAEQHNRSLVIVPTTGRISDFKSSEYLSLCDAFDFSGNNIVCTTDVKVIPLKCFAKLDALDRFVGMTRFCFDGRIW